MSLKFKIPNTSTNISLLIRHLLRHTPVTDSVFVRTGSVRSRGNHGPGPSSLTPVGPLQCGWHNLGRKVKVGPEERDPLVGEVPVEMPPSKSLLHITKRVKALHGFDDFQVGNVFQLGMFGCVEVFFGDHDTFLKKVFIDRLTVPLGNKHFGTRYNSNLAT